MRLFRQSRAGEWDDVFERMAEVLAARVAGVSALGEWNRLGVLAYQSGSMEAALDHFGCALAAAPADPMYRSNRGAVLHRLERLAEAEADYREVLRLDPAHADTLNNLCVLLRNLGRFSEAAAILQPALALNPADPVIPNNLSVVLRGLGRRNESEACARRRPGSRARVRGRPRQPGQCPPGPGPIR